MQRDEFDHLIQRLEKRANRNPVLYEWYVAGLVLLAYTYLLGVLVLATGLLLGVVALACAAPNVLTIKLAIVFGLAAGSLCLAIFRGLWVRLAPPVGMELTAAEAPELFAQIAQLRQQLQSDPFHKVLLVNDYNAAVVQTPRLGVFGWQRNYLILGLPLLLGLSPEEFKAVLAHEFGHLSKNHARFNGWIYRVRRTWEHIFHQMAQRRRSDLGLLRYFCQWFWPKFNASAFVLSRLDEYVADRCAADLLGAGTAATALLRVRVQRPLVLEKFWPELHARADELPAPPVSAFTELATRLTAPGDPAETAQCIRHSLLEATNNTDTHPCLRDRLTALGQLPADASEDYLTGVLSQRSGPSAAAVFLGAKLEELTTKMGREWAGEVEKYWAQRHQEIQKLKQELARTEAAAGGDNTVEVLWRRALLLAYQKGDPGALATIAEILERQPEHPGANFFKGRYLLLQGNAGGIPCLELAMQADQTLVPNILNLLHHYYGQLGATEKLLELDARYQQYKLMNKLAQAERSELETSDVFTPHALSPAELEETIALLAAEPDILTASLVRKTVKHFPQQPCFVLRLDKDDNGPKPPNDEADQELVKNLVKQIKLPGSTHIFIANARNQEVGNAILAVPGCTLYHRHP